MGCMSHTVMEFSSIYVGDIRPGEACYSRSMLPLMAVMLFGFAIRSTENVYLKLTLAMWLDILFCILVIEAPWNTCMMV